MNATELENLSTCPGFVRGVLQLESYDWAQRIFADLDKRGSAVAAKGCNGCGKTERIAAPIALWHAAIFPKSLTVATSGVFRQVEQQLFGAIEGHRHRFPGWTFNNCEVVTHTGSRILGFSTDQPGRFEGWHADNLLLIADEAKTVPDSIFEAMARCQPTRTLLLSSPGGCSGEFYRAFGERAKFYTCHSIPASLCPHIKGEWITAQVEKWGENHRMRLTGHA